MTFITAASPLGILARIRERLTRTPAARRRQPTRRGPSRPARGKTRLSAPDSATALYIRSHLGR